ncbi:MAG: DUF2459 domain-containing protein [Planctomycetes bacterium]|nr:DUF2459 domain-containing protein [Planctomycetota bacterium]
MTLLLLSACALPVDGVWPPAPGGRTHRVDVRLDLWHSVITVYPEDAASPGPESSGTGGSGTTRAPAREWGYADRAYYLENHTGVSGCCGALFWPTEAVLRVAPEGVSFAHVDPRSPVPRWSFDISEEGHRRLCAFLDREKQGPVVSRIADSEWFRARTDYHLFHHCNHWTSRALRAAGLPVWSGYSLFRWSFALQLDRAQRWQEAVRRAAEPQAPRPAGATPGRRRVARGSPPGR